jgi:hypothetical protein
VICGIIFTKKRTDHNKTCSEVCSWKYQERLRSSKKEGRPKTIASRYNLSLETSIELRKNCAFLYP